MQDIDLLVSRLCNEEMPIFSQTVSYIKKFSENDRTSTSELAQGILGDASLTAKVLKLANSIYYNPDIVPVNTIHWAILRMGHNSLKSLCLSSSLIENLLSGQTRKRVIREMVRSFHAAVQAKALAVARKDSGVEEVFIATLLFRLGHIAFYCFGGELVDQLEASMQKPGYSQAMAEREVLGFSLDKLAAALAKEWNLGELLRTSIDRDAKSDPRVNYVLLGHKLAENAERGWNSHETKTTIQSISKFLNKPSAEVTKMVQENAQKASHVGRDYGLGAHTSLIPVPEEVESGEPDRRPASEDLPAPRPTATIQREIMQELSALVRDKRMDVNMFLSALLEGILRGIGMDRVLLAILTSDWRRIVGKYGLGWEKEDVERFVFPRKTTVPHIFDHVLDMREAFWVDEAMPGGFLQYLTPEVKAVMTTPFFVMPLVVRNKAIGLICADRSLSRRALDQESFTSFTFFYQLANKALPSFS
mgnify:FL=1